MSKTVDKSARARARVGPIGTFVYSVVKYAGWLAAVLLLGYLLLMEATVGRALRWLQRRRGGDP